MTILKLIVLLLVITISNSIILSNSIKQRLASVVLAGGMIGIPSSVLATTFSGTVRIAGSTTTKPTTGALYITVRQDVGVWESSVRNYKPPPLMAKKIPIDDVNVFPLQVSLDDTTDVTIEGKDLSWENKKKPKPLLFSARLDSDSDANTRSPNDLVGQIANIRFENGAWQNFEIGLGGRGGLGKALVGKGK